ncbi:MAG: glycosyltransferase family 39 protein [Bacteroidales bacterium]|nr:glycosyltransferase family 39 protein [Bacteroidales bacterium]
MRRHQIISLIIAVVAAIFYVPLTGRLHLFDWDEINFAESAREMLLTGDYLTVRIFFEPFWEKPPLFIWFQVLSMKIFGVNEFAARFPNAIAGIITLVALFNMGRKILNEKFGIIWTIAYGVSLLPFLYFKSGIIDPFFNLFIFLGVANYIYAQKAVISKHKYIRIILSAFFIGLAVLTKGPVALLVFGLLAVVLLFTERFILFLHFGHVLLFIAVFVVTGGFWFILQIFAGNAQTIIDFFVYQFRLFSQKDAGHGGFPLYHFVVLFFGVFPASVFVINAHKKTYSENELLLYFRKTMLALFWIVLILFSIVKTKIVHYSSLCYFPMSFLAAYSIYGFVSGKKKFPSWLLWTQLSLGLIYGLIITAFPVFDKYKQWFIDTGKITQAFTVGNLQAEPGWSGFEFLIGLLLIAGIVYSFFLLKRAENSKGLKIMAATSVLFISLSVVFVSPKVEKYSQHAAIEFFKSIKGKDAYIHTFYKSYAMLFYTKALPQENSKAFNLGWLVTGKIDKDAYIVIRADKKESTMSNYPGMEVLYEKNGYVFCIRKAQAN